MKEILGILAIVMGFIAILPYIIAIYKREAKPHMFSWIIWAIVCAVGGTIQLMEGGGAGSWFLLANTVFIGGIATAAYWLGTTDIKRIDWLVLSVALISIVIWVITDNPIWSLIIIVGIDAIAYIPTIRKSWNKPYEEPVLSWFLSIVTFSLAFSALEAYSITTYLYPVIFILINSLLVIYLLLRRKMVS